MTLLDLVVLALLVLAVSRGLWIGMVRELFSLGAVAAACIAAWVFASTGGAWLAEQSGIARPIATGIAGFTVGIATLTLLAITGRFAKRGVEKAGLGGFDRFGGALLGSAEGVIVATLLLSLAIYALGRDDPLLSQSKSLEAFEALEDWALGPITEEDFLDVAAPPPGFDEAR